MRYRKLPLRIRLKVEDYYEHRFHHKLFDEDIILNELSKALREVNSQLAVIVEFALLCYATLCEGVRLRDSHQYLISPQNIDVNTEIWVVRRVTTVLICDEFLHLITYEI